MPLLTYQATMNISLAQAKKVEECAADVAIYKAKNQAYQLYTEGLNPCIGLVVCGELHFPRVVKKQVITRVSYFVGIAHLEGLPHQVLMELANGEARADQKCAAYCAEAFLNLLSKTESAAPADSTILLNATYLLRCSQLDKHNIQETVGLAFTELLADKQKLADFIQNEMDNVEIAEAYQHCYFSPDEEIIDQESDAIHLFVKANGEQAPSVICYKGHKNLKDIIAPTNLLSSASFFNGSKRMKMTVTMPPAPLNYQP